jgi:hypothetical protein
MSCTSASTFERRLIQAAVGSDPLLPNGVRMVHPQPNHSVREAF